MSAVVIGYSVTGTCLQYIFVRSDWDRLSKLIVERNGGIESYSSSEESEESGSSEEESVSRRLKGKTRRAGIGRLHI
jgi:hypothetical protein